MELTLYQVDAFTNRTFGGNPAAVCALKDWLPDETLQNIAAENNLSETAFFMTDGDGVHLRWFTPTKEVELCGHATLATAYVIFEHIGFAKKMITFSSLSGNLQVTKTDQGYTLDFPIWNFEPIAPCDRLSKALGANLVELYKGNDWVAVLENEEQVRSLTPDMHALMAFKDARCIAVTAKANDKNIDFVSRNFAPRLGIPEDPLTGSTHCMLAPLWSEKLDKTKLKAKQISQRGGDLFCEVQEDRVLITGDAKLYLKGSIYI